MHLQLKIGITIILIVGLPVYVIADNLIQALQQSKIQNMFNYSNIIKYVGTGIVIVGTTLAVRGGMKDSMKHRGNMDDLR
jgi:uncharacterized membrane protein YidH (DUF202 family)